MASEVTPVVALSPLQEKSIAHANARINIWSGAVRSGKTIASLLRWVMFVAQAPRGGALVVSGKTYDTVSRNIFGPLMDPELFGPVAPLVRYTRGAPTATILGRTIEVITANDAKSEGRLRGLTAAGAYVDEATLVPREFWAQLLARLSMPGAKVFATTNPDGPQHWLRQEFILREHELNLRHWHFSLDDNPFLPAEYVSDLKREYVGLWYRRFVRGEWCLAEGAVFDMWNPDVMVVDVVPQIQRWIGLGVDYGNTNPFAALVLGLGTDGRLYLTHEWRWDSRRQHRQLTDHEYSVRLREWLAGLQHSGMTGIRPMYAVVDPSAASFRTQLWQDGLSPIDGDNAVLDGIRTVASLLARDKLKVHRSCTGWINEIPGYSWDPDKAARGEDAPIKADDHSLDAGRYVVRTTESAWRHDVRREAA